MTARTTPGWAALLTPYTWAETQERYQAVREAEARRALGAAGQTTTTKGDS